MGSNVLSRMGTWCWVRGAATVVVAAAFVWCAGGVRPTHAGEPPPSREEAAKSAAAVVEAARKAARGDAATLEALRAARDALEPWSDEVRDLHRKEGSGAGGRQFAAVWNELLTVADYHGAKFKSEYVLDRTEVLWKRYLVGLPTGERWSWSYNKDKETSDQLYMLIDQKRPNGKDLRRIKVWVYRWDTVYSGVGGENYKKLAKVMHELDRDSLAKSGRKSSNSVTSRRLNAEFPRAYYYFVEGLDVDAEKTLRRDNYYLKGDNISFNLEVITYIDATDGDDDVTKWQASEDGPEIAALLASLATNPDKDK